MRILQFRTQEQINHILKMEKNSEIKLTVRRGSKWNIDKEQIHIENAFTKESITFGDIVYTKLKKFSECRDEILSSHFMFLTYKSVLKHLKEVYENFSEDEIVTLVYFKTV